MRTVGVLLLTLLAIAAPAQAQVIIQEAPGSQGASMEPTFFLNADTARILPRGLQYISLAGGGFTFLGQNLLGLEYNRGMGAGGELEASVFGLWTYPLEVPALPPLAGSSNTQIARFSPYAALGYKERFAILGGWDAALSAEAAYEADSLAPYGSLLVGVPFTTEVGPGDLTLEPRIELVGNSSPPKFAYGDLGMIAGYRLPLGSQWRLLFDASGAYAAQAPLPTGLGARLGVRYMPLPTFAIDAGLGLSFLDADLVHPDGGSVANLAMRFGF